MAETTVTVATDMVLRTEEFLAKLRSLEAEIATIRARISSQPFAITAMLDDQVTRQLDELVADANRAVIKIVAVANDSALKAQIDLVREQQQAKPIVIPVEYVAVGGMPAV